MSPRSLGALLLFLSIGSVGTSARVVVNEIFYHAPNEVQDLAYVELFNSAGAPVDLSGWKLTKGIEHEFASGTKIEALGYLVLARNAARFKEFYGFAPAGTFEGALSHKGMRIDLVDAHGKKKD